MPQTVISAGQTATIGTGESTPRVVGARKSLVMVLISGDAYWGWTDSRSGTVTAAGATDAGIPMVIGEKWTFDGESLRFNNTLRVFTVAGATINYQELKHP